MDAITPRTSIPLLPAIADAIAEWFPELNKRALAVSECTVTKENVPTLPLVMVAFVRSTGPQPTTGNNLNFEITDAFIIEFWLEPARYKKANGSETPFWSYYPYQEIRDKLLTNLSYWQTPNGERIAYRGLNIEAESVAVTLTFAFVAVHNWCPSKRSLGMPFSIGFNLCAPAGCCPDEICKEPDPCA